MRRGGDVASLGRHGPKSDASAAQSHADPHGAYRAGQGWPAGAKPLAAAGTAVAAFATALDHPRWLYVLPNGDVLVAETNAPPKPDDGKGIKGWIMKRLKAKAGAGTPSANRITLLRDADGDGVAETRTVFIEGLNSPFGMALVGNDFYVANADAVLRFPYARGETRIAAPGTKVVDLPGGPINHHWTKNLIASVDGSKLYVTVGSNSNVAENGIDKEEGRAAIWEVDPKTGSHRIFASGMRNPNGLAWEPRSGALWTVVNERDELGSDLVPDYLTSVADGGFYGWPWSYYGQHVDARVQPQRPELVAKAIKPDYALGPHVAPLGLAASQGTALPAVEKTMSSTPTRTRCSCLRTSAIRCSSRTGHRICSCPGTTSRISRSSDEIWWRRSDAFERATTGARTTTFSSASQKRLGISATSLMCSTRGGWYRALLPSRPTTNRLRVRTAGGRWRTLCDEEGWTATPNSVPHPAFITPAM